MKFNENDISWVEDPKKRKNFLTKVSNGRMAAYVISCTISNILTEKFTKEIRSNISLREELSAFMFIEIMTACNEYNSSLWDSVMSARMRVSYLNLAMVQINPQLLQEVNISTEKFQWELVK